MTITHIFQFAGLGLWLAALASPHWLVAVPRFPYEHGHDGGDHDGDDDLIEYDNLDAQADVG